MKKVCLIASSGGHFEQVLRLKPLLERYDGFIVTEKTEYSDIKNDMYYLKQVNRHDRGFIISMFQVTLQSFKIFFKEKPDVIISTGALVVIPMIIIGKLFRKQIVFIESFAKITSPTLTGRLVYRLADQFYIQWESMREFYPNALYKGGIY